MEIRLGRRVPRTDPRRRGLPRSSPPAGGRTESTAIEAADDADGACQAREIEPVTHRQDGDRGSDRFPGPPDPVPARARRLAPRVSATARRSQTAPGGVTP